MVCLGRWVVVGAVLLIVVIDGAVYQQRLRAAKIESLFRAIEADRPADVSDLLHRGLRPTTRNEDGVPAIGMAALQEDSTLVTLLLRSGAPADERDMDGATSLMRASAWNRLETVRTLLASGADVNATANCGWTSLHHAANHNNGEIIRLLIEAGANVHARRADGVSPLHLALSQGYAEAARELLHGGAAVEREDRRTVATLLGTRSTHPHDAAMGQKDQPGLTLQGGPVMTD